ncbi:MAG TPA: thiamine-phosphate kinase [Bryobacteraceae bacterium]|nr:thiamine-phosphate kinase [Bryobacteraceae bacterium]
MRDNRTGLPAGGSGSELEILESIRRRARLPGQRGLALGIGDDCAIYRPPGAREDLLFTTDLLLEDVHFRHATHPPEALGHKALARGLSDIAAMGGVPRFCLLSLAAGPRADRRWIDRFYTGLLRLARICGAPLAGGDLAHSAKTGCDIVVCGAVPRGAALRRDGARAGDSIYVSGRLGGSALGLGSGTGKAWLRHLRPQPRLALGVFLRERIGASAAIDLSDGISLDLRRMALASGLEAAIDPPPRFPGANPEQALHGGEDYELLFTVGSRVKVPPRLGSIPLTRIGVMRRGQAGAVYLLGKPLPALGYDHFRGSP